MTKFNSKEKIITCLRENKSKMTAKEIAEWIMKTYPKEVRVKELNKKSDIPILDQLRSEIGARKNVLKEHGVSWNENSPRQYFMSDLFINESIEEVKPEEKLKEYELYPKLMSFLFNEFGTRTKRIDEKTSKNSKGKGANKHLHPDIVGITPKGSNYDSKVKSLASHFAQPIDVISSFEVKVQLNISNVREHYNQAVLNSSWSHEGYLVASEIVEGCLDELKMLVNQFGIGVIHLNSENIDESKVLFPSKVRDTLGLDTINKLCQENSDFDNFLTLLQEYYQTGKLKERDWN